MINFRQVCEAPDWAVNTELAGLALLKSGVVAPVSPEGQLGLEAGGGYPAASLFPVSTERHINQPHGSSS